jgi:hypothetical protein
MSNIQKHQANKALMVTETEKRAYDVMYAPKAIDTNTNTYVDLLTQVYAVSGQKSSGVDMAILAKQLKAEINTYFKHLTFAELSIAINNALRGEYGEIYGINVVTFHKAIKGYLNAENTLRERKAVLARLNNPPQKDLPAEEKEDRLKASFNRLKQDVKDGKSLVDDFGAMGCYNWLVANKRLTQKMFTDKELSDIKDQATEILRAKYAADTQSVNRETRTAAKFMIKKLTDGFLENHVLSICKKLCLELAFKTNRI